MLVHFHIRLFFFFILFTSYTVSVQQVNDEPLVSGCFASALCNYRLSDTSTSLPFSNIVKIPNINYGKYDTSADYPGDVVYKIEYTPPDGCISNGFTGASDCDKTNNGVLRYDVYYPADYTKYKTCPLPAVIFVHGGGFSNCKQLGTGSSPDAEAFAQRGFVVFNVEYRTGVRLPGPGFPTDPNGKAYVTVQQQLAVYRASQDVRGAIRSIIQRQNEQYSLLPFQRAPYQIDVNNLFLGGASAGSITVLDVAYYPRQSMVDSVNPYVGSVSISQALGPINANWYYGDTSISYVGKIKGILAQWGSLAVPPNYDSLTAKNFFDQRIPIIAFHGLQDDIVDPYIRDINFAPALPNTTRYKDSFNVERSCLKTQPFRVNGSNLPGPDIYTYGSPSYYRNILQPLGIRSELYLDCDAQHGLRNAGSTFKADYGTSYGTEAQVGLYIIGRAATFFQNIIGSSPQTSHKVFVECKNRRVTCFEPNDDDNCLATDNCSNRPH